MPHCEMLATCQCQADVGRNTGAGTKTAQYQRGEGGSPGGADPRRMKR